MLHQLPRIHNQPYRLAILTDEPTKDDLLNGKLFSSSTGSKLLFPLLARSGIVAEACFIGCAKDPDLLARLEHNKPNLVLLLGDDALRAAKTNVTIGPDDEPQLEVLDLDDEDTKKKNKTPIDKWRGSLFLGFGGRYKCLATYHPRTIFQSYAEQIYPFGLDLKRARTEAVSSTLTLPVRNCAVQLSPIAILEKLDQLLFQRPVVACDIEGYIDTMSCISFATSAEDAFIVPTCGDFWGSLEPLMWRSLARVLSDPKIPKILQNCLYDTFVLQYSYSIPVRGIVDDTMLKHWELFCELPKALGFQTSVYTREPYYKADRHSETRETFWTYCCKDSAVTFEINNVLDKQLSIQAKKHYSFNLSLIDPILYIELKGIRYDHEKAHSKILDIEAKASRLQFAINEIAGCGLPNDHNSWIRQVADSLCYKKFSNLCDSLDSLVQYSKPSCLADVQRAVDLLRLPLSCASIGELSSLCGVGLNVKSVPQMAEFLYGSLGLPTQYKKEHGRLTDKVTTDVLALLKLYGKSSHPVLKLILSLRSLRDRTKNLRASCDSDGRIRCGYNVVGTETGRLSCYESPTGSGFNLQTATKKDRDLFIADDGYWLFQCDLSGADGWTVAAHCKAVGDATMWDDYVYGIKPARVIALLYTHGAEVLSWSREKIKKESKTIDNDGWLYFACKCVQHGSNYGMSFNTVSDTILRQSYKLFGYPIFVSPDVCAQLQRFYFSRYIGIKGAPNLVCPNWHAKVKSQLLASGTLVSSCGHTRRFFGRRDDFDTLKQALAHEPQMNTTYATNLALSKLWTDPENRYDQQVVDCSESTKQQRSRVQLRIQPLHQVHDALIGQFRKEDTSWAVPRIKSYFNNPITIAGTTVIIPFEGSYGPSWGELGTKHGGGEI